jgi:DNA-binding NarL/FixJ family response regulator
MKRGGILIVSRSAHISSLAKTELQRLGFRNVWGTTQEGNGLNRLINTEKPHLIFMESSFYGCNTPYMMGRLLHDMPYLRIAVFNLGDYPADLEPRFIGFGAESYITLRNGKEEFYHGMTEILRGKSFIASTVEKRIEEGKDQLILKPAITPREREVMRLLLEGFSTREIKERLNICFRTVENHKKHIFKRLQVKNTVQMIRAALVSGELDINGYLGVTNGDTDKGSGIPGGE